MECWEEDGIKPTKAEQLNDSLGTTDRGGTDEENETERTKKRAKKKEEKFPNICMVCTLLQTDQWNTHKSTCHVQQWNEHCGIGIDSWNWYCKSTVITEWSATPSIRLIKSVRIQYEHQVYWVLGLVIKTWECTKRVLDEPTSEKEKDKQLQT